MSKFNIGDKVISNDSRYLSEEIGTIVGIDTRENASNKYLVKFDSLDISEGWAYGCFRDISLLIIEPYDGYAIWLDDLEKVENESEEVCMSEFNIGDRVVSKGYPHLGEEEVGVIVGIDTREEVEGKYLVKFDSLDEYSGWACRVYINDPYYIIEPYEGYAVWLDDLEKVENESEEVCMSEFNIGDKVISKGYPNLGEEVGIIVGIDLRKESNSGKYLVKFNSLDMSSGWVYGVFRSDLNFIIEPYEGYAEWVDEDDLVKVEDKCKENECEEGEICMSEFNIGDKVVSNDSRYSGKDVGVIIGIDPREDAKGGKYLVKFDSLDASERYAMWLNDVIKVEDESKKECEEECEEDIRTKFESVRKQKEEIIKEKSKKVLELTLEIKEIEHEIEKIKKEWHL